MRVDEIFEFNHGVLLSHWLQERVCESNDPEPTLALADQYYEEGNYFQASTLYELVLSHYRGRSEAERIYYRYADTHFRLGKYVTAVYYFERFSLTYANSELRELSDFMIANSYYELSPSFRLDQQYTEKAITAYQQFVNYHPTSERVGKANDIIDELRRKQEKKAFDGAELYYNMGNYKSALHSFQNILKDYPETPDAERIRYLIVKASYDLAHNSYYEKKEERFEDVITNFDIFKKHYKASKYLNELEVLKGKSIDQLNSLKDV